ncbi:hypothetical protein D3C75_649400 [compost metagenome]
MGSLGDFFPDGIRQQAVDATLAPGCVIYWHCNFTTPPKQKFLVVVCCEPSFLVLIINSEINQFIQSKPHLLNCQVPISQAEHAFLNWDSFVNCIEAHKSITLNDVKDAVIADFSHVSRGRLSEGCIADVIKAVEQSPTMPRREKEWIIASLTPLVTK